MFGCPGQKALFAYLFLIPVFLPFVLDTIKKEIGLGVETQNFASLPYSNVIKSGFVLPTVEEICNFIIYL